MDSKQRGRATAAKGPIEKELSALMARRRNRGMVGAAIRVMVVGIPNVGKSTFINTFAGSARAKEMCIRDRGDTLGLVCGVNADFRTADRLHVCFLESKIGRAHV